MPDPKSLELWLKRLETQHNKKIDLGLKRVQKVYTNLKLEKIAPTIITVAGTNGKGSTVAILSAICQQAGLNVGEFTSPHIKIYNERIKINSICVKDSFICAAFEKIEDNLQDISLSYFEYSTLAAVSIFKNQAVDVAILEVGLGGRLDSVNVIDSDCAIITTIDIDHTAFLGNDIESIAHEKAGIMRPHTPVIYGDENCPKAIIQHAKKIKAKLFFTQVFDNKLYKKPNIKGEYQLLNAATAIKALRVLGDTLDITSENINAGLQNIKLQARLQRVSEFPEIIFDVSHNQQAAKSLSNWLNQNPVKGQTFAVFAVLEDKESINWLQEFKQCIDVWCISTVQSERSLPTQDLLKILANFANLIVSFDSVTLAYEKAQLLAKADDRIIVFGSFYTVSEVCG